MKRKPETVQRSLLEFLVRNTGAKSLRDSDDVFSLGLMNSLLVIRLVAFVEGEFGIVLRGDDLDAQHFRTVNALTALISSKQT